MNKKGQALIEFIIILPIFIMMMLAVFDCVRIYSEKSKLESIIEDVILDDNTYSDVNVTKNRVNKGTEYVVSKDIEIYSPVVSVVTGNKYNVTDNAIRKWCEKFNLPKRKSDINKYSDLDWSKI